MRLRKGMLYVRSEVQDCSHHVVPVRVSYHEIVVGPEGLARLILPSRRSY